VQELTSEVVTTSRNKYFVISKYLQDMSTTMTSLASSTNVSWPYYTQWNFPTTFGQAYLDNTGASLIAWSPIVQGDLERVEWGQYSTDYAGEWMPTDMAKDIPANIYTKNENGELALEQGLGPFLPVWEMAVADLSITTIDPTVVNYNILNNDQFATTLDEMSSTSLPALSPILNATEIYGRSVANVEPTSLLLTPIYAEMSSFLDKDQQPTVDNELAGVLVAVLPWSTYFKELLHPAQPKMSVVIEQEAACGEGLTFTMEIVGESSTYLGPGFLVSEEYLPYGTTFASGDGSCFFTIGVYPTEEALVTLNSKDNTAAVWTSIVVLIILFIGFVLFAYDYAVQRRMMKTMHSAAKTNAVLASLFPAEVRDRLIGKKSKDGLGGLSDIENLPTSVNMLPESTTYRLKNYLAGEDGAMGIPASEEKVKQALASIDMHDTKPIAELFPHTTVLMADIAGFTAWSSVREPSQVFTLLETVYRAFDNIAKRRKVFKVETVGDCYVAVTGLPEARPDHAVVMAKFAKECLEKFNELSKQLEISLGPDTVSFVSEMIDNHVLSEQN
jgi:hypothetical protein